MSSIFSPPVLWFLIQLHLHESTPSIMSTVHEYILWLCWGLLTLCHKDLKNPVHDMLLPTVEVMEKHLSSISCDASFVSASALQKHENGPKHIQRMSEAGL